MAVTDTYTGSDDGPLIYQVEGVHFSEPTSHVQAALPIFWGVLDLKKSNLEF
jgi:hypothetical protein